MSRTIEKYSSASITDDVIKEAANLFSKNYGIWSPQASANMGSFAVAGSRVKLSPAHLKQQILPQGAENIHVRLKIGEQLVGSVFASRMIFQGRPLLWITQLCVVKEFRNQGIAKELLASLPRGDEQGYGILSSHPYAKRAVLGVYGGYLEDGGVDFEMTRLYAEDILRRCPVGYVKEAKVERGLFSDEKDVSESYADTGYWVDHKEVNEALKSLKDKGVKWTFGELPEGHEYLLVVRNKT